MSSDTGTLRIEAVDLSKCLLHFVYDLQYLGLFVSDLEYWLVNSPSPWDSYRSLMTCRLVNL